MLHPSGPQLRTLGESTNQLIQKLLGADLEVEGVPAVLDADVEELEGEDRSGMLAPHSHS